MPIIGQFGDVLITGGTGALGSAVTKAFLDAGARCHVAWRSERELERFELRERVTLHQADVSSEASVVKLFAGLPGIGASVHLVGGFALGAIETISAEDFSRMMQVNAVSCFLCCRE